MERRLEELFAHEAWLRRVAASLAGPDADDLVQETWIAAMRHPPADDRPVRPWLARVVRNLARMRHRGATRRAAREREVVATAADSTEALVVELETHQRLTGLILGLEEAQRQVLLLSFGAGLSSSEIAKRLGIPAGTVRWRLKTALDELRRHLGEEAPRRRALLLGPFWKGIALAKAHKLLVGLVVLLMVSFFTARRWVAGSQERSRPRAAAAARPVKPEASSATLHGGGGGGRKAPSWMTAPSLRPRRVAGRVVVADGRAPLAGARVRLTGEATESGAVPIPERLTAADGTFDFGSQPATQLNVTAMAPGRLARTIEIDLRGPGRRPQPDALELALEPCEATVSGQVTDADGAPIAGAHVTPHGERAMVVTGEDGAYEMCARPGVVYLSATADGYAGARSKTETQGGRGRLDFTLGGGVPVSVEVLRLEDGAPVAGAHVAASAVGEAEVLPPALHGVTDETGRVRFDPVLPAKLNFFVVGDGVMTTDYADLVVEAGKPNEIQILVETMARVSGTVKDERGRPVSGALLATGGRFLNPNDGEAVTQEDGSFVMAWGHRGEVDLYVRNYQVISPRRLKIEGDLGGVDVRVASGRSISGRVMRAGKPVGQARVHVFAARTEGGPPPSAISEDDGTFRLGGLEAHPVEILAFAGSSPFKRSRTEKVDLTSADATGVILEVGGAEAQGVVVDEDGKPVGRAIVVLKATHGQDYKRDYAGEDGKFKLEDLDDDEDYDVSVSLDGLTLPAATPFPLAHVGADLRLVVRAKRTALAGVIVDARGQPVAGATLAAARNASVSGSAVSDAAGAFRFADLLLGSYDVSARSADGALRTRISGVAAGRDDVRLVLATPGSLAGTVTGFKGTPAVRVQDLLPPYDVAAAPLARGRFEATGLLPGTYIVTAQAPGEQAVARVVVKAGARAEVELAGQGSGTLSAQVVEMGSRAPVAGASCRAMPRSGDDVVVGAGGATTELKVDGGGNATGVVPAGELRLACWAPDYSDATVAVTVARDQTATARVALVRAGARANPGLMLDPWRTTPRILAVDEGGAAAEAGLRPGDVITAVDGVAVDSRAAYVMISWHPAGTTVEVTTTRGVSHLTLR